VRLTGPGHHLDAQLVDAHQGRLAT
jgi:hypothetical protein